MDSPPMSSPNAGLGMSLSFHSSPMKNREHSPIVLTPRKKIAAMLKAMDDSDSDSDSEDRPAKVKAPVLSEKQTKTTAPVPSEIPENVSENEEEEESLVFAPKGRMARRMQGRVQKIVKDLAVEEEGEDSDEDDDIPTASRKSRTALTSNSNDANDDEDEDEDAIIAPKRRMIRKSQLPAKVGNGAGSGDESSKEVSRQTTPPSSGGPASDASEDEELPGDLLQSNKFMALVEKKRTERLAKEAVDEEKRKKRMAEQQELFGDSNEANEEDDSEIEDKLTQSTRGKSRPQRKASKNALFEMQRETQRMARNTQLNVVPEVAKNYSLQNFFDAFGYKPQTGSLFSKPLPTPPASSSPPVEPVDIVTAVPAVTSEESNPFIVDDDNAINAGENAGKGMEVDDELPSIDELIAIPKETADTEKRNLVDDGKLEGAEISSSPAKKLDKGKGKAMEQDLITEKTAKTVRTLAVPIADDSDSDDLEIIKPTVNLRGKSFKAISAPGNATAEPRALHDLRRLAGVNSREDSEQFGAKLRQKQLTRDLLKRSREQARLAEEEKKAELRAKGHYVPTAEELQQDKKAAEDIWEKHQAEAQAIREREKKDEAREKGVRVSELTDDSENDSDWLEDAEGGENDDDDNDDVELSGSEDEEAGDEGSAASADEDDDDEPTSAQGTPRMSDMPETFLMDEADEADESADDESEDGDNVPVKMAARRKRAAVIDDESDNEDGVQVKSSMPEALPLADLGTPPPVMGLTQMFNGSMPSQVVQASNKASGDQDIPLAGLGTQDVPMGLTQMFEASMADSPKKNNMDLLRQTQDEIELPGNPAKLTLNDDGETQNPISLDYSQSQIQYEPESLVPDFYPSQMSQIPPPTPDTGFQSHLVPAPPRFDSPQREEPTQVTSNKSGDTVSTLPMSPEQGLKQRKGRLVRKSASGEKEPENAFSLMKKAATARPVDDFDKSKSNAKGMIEEVAEESEDEYAGIGGKSDDEDDDDDASVIENLINDDEKEKVNEREVAGLYRKMEGADDLKQVQDLMKRLENGGLKRRRGGGLFDLSDSEDEADRKVRARRRLEARLRRELLKESGISEIANNPKQSAFFTTLEHREEVHFLDQEEILVESSETRRPLEPTSANNSAPQADEDDCEAESQSKKRRRAKAKSIADVKRSVSNLLDDGESASLTLVEETASEDDEDESVVLSFKKRRVEIVDRMAMKRASTMTSETTRMAFQSVSVETKLPALLRRSTTSQLSEVSQPKDRVSTTSASSRGGSGGARASASINWCQRENSRRKLVEKLNTEKKTEQKKMMGKRREGMSGIMAQGGFS